MGVDLWSNAIDTSHALRTSGRATRAIPQSVPPNLQVDFKLPLALTRAAADGTKYASSSTLDLVRHIPRCPRSRL